MSRVVIVGAGDFGREVAAWLAHDEVFRGNDDVVFIDDDPEVLARHPRLASQLVGSIREFVPGHGDRILMGISNPRVKRDVVGLLGARGVTFSTFVHRSVICAESAEVGQGTIVCPNAVISSDARLGQLVTVNVSASVGHDATVGDFASLMSHVDVTGWVSIGESCFLGSHASVLPRVKVEPESTVGAGSIVIRRVARGTTVMGVPARRL